MARLKPATLLKLTLLHGCFPLFLNCTNSTKSRNASHVSNNEPELENDGNEIGSNSDSDHEHIQDLDSDSNSKRILTYQRKVHSIDTTLEESNYTPMALPEELKTIQGIANGDKNCHDTVYEFSNKKTISNRGHQRRADILVGKPGPTATGKNSPAAIYVFYKFFTNEMIDLILERTN